MKKIILTGGGTGGHVTPNIALLPKLKENGYEIFYVGSENGIEKKLIEECKIPFYGVSSGKLRRYLDIKNITDALRVVKGLGDSIKVIKKIKPDVIFSKGGFVSVPVVLAGKICKVPVVIHESDFSSGLANKISIPYAVKVCTSFPETIKEIGEKGVITGTPIRDELFKGNKEKGYKLSTLTSDKPIILIMGGSQGSVKINNCVREALNELLEKYQIIHLCGKNNLDKHINKKGYVQFEYISKELTDLFAISDLIISRAGANSIFEFLALKKPNLLIPLSKNASRGDQIVNAKSFEKHGYSLVMEEEDLDPSVLVRNINELFNNRFKYINNMNKSELSDSVSKIVDIIKQVTK